MLEAHTEATTVGSVILAGIILKLGTYGLYKFALPFFHETSATFQLPLLLICLIGFIFSSLSAIRQIDLKKNIAFASVAHMNVILISLFCNSELNIRGALFQSIIHGIVASALFFFFFFLYERFGTKNIKYIKGLTLIFPILSLKLLIFCAANCNLPLTGNFIGEIMLLLGLVPFSIIFCFIILILTTKHF